jgi:putative transposase
MRLTASGAAADEQDGDCGARAEAAHPKPAPGHKVFPYLLPGLAIQRPNQVWCAGITYIRIGRGFLYFVAIMDWQAGRCWRGGCRTSRSALMRSRRRSPASAPPEIFNTDQGSQFTSAAFTGMLADAGIRIFVISASVFRTAP